MKKKCELFVMFLFLMLINGVSAMEHPIVVESYEGYAIRIFVWPEEYGPALNIAKGIANEDGIYSITFFSLNTPDIKYQITIYDEEGDLTNSQTFTEYGIDKPLKFDCTYTDKCVVSIMTTSELEALGLGEEKIIEVEENTTQDIENETVNETENTIEEVEIVTISSGETGGNISLSLNYNSFILLLIGGILTFMVLMFAYFKFENLRDLLIQINYFSTDAELARIKAQIKRKDVLIEKIREKNIKEGKIRAARRELEEENRKLEKIIRRKMQRKKRESRRRY